MRQFYCYLIGAFILFVAANFAKGDIVVGTDGRLTDGKIVSSDDKETVLQTDAIPATQPTHIDHANVFRAIFTDEHGALINGPATQPAAHWNAPKEPAAPPVVEVKSPSYYVIPLHGEVGSTVLAGALEKSFADAVLRKPTVVILDIDSPGGSVAEAEKIISIIHHYNKQLRIVALANQDLSAAAIFSLSVKTIYVKPTGTIGAATSFIPGHPDLSAKVEEKMQSAWRAVARNSAEEGGHEPLLADAMIDNTQSLHLETINGKPVVKTGDGEKMLVAKGKILTLTSHEAVDCGLAVDDAEDFAALGEALGFANWTECKGLGTVLADSLPARDQAFQAQFKLLAADFGQNIQMAALADPTEENSYTVFQNGPTQRFNPRQPVGPNNPPPGMPGPRQPSQVVRSTRQDTVHWKQRSLACVIAIQLAEQSLHNLDSLCEAFGQSGEMDSINDVLAQIGAVRAKMYDDRSKFGESEGGPPGIVSKGLGLPIASGRPGRPARQPAAPPPAAPQLVAQPSADDLAAQLKKIDAGWQPSTTQPVELLPGMTSVNNNKNDDGSILLGRNHNVTTAEKYQAPVTFRIIARSNGGDFRIAFPADQIIFNWEGNPDQLRVDGGPLNGKNKDGVGRLPLNEWVGIELVVKTDEIIVYVNGEERYREKADLSAVDRTMSITSHTRQATIKSVSVVKK